MMDEDLQMLTLVELFHIPNLLHILVYFIKILNDRATQNSEQLS